MKDAYSFDADLEQLNASYDAMYEAYCRIFDRCGLPYVVVEAESGPIGGDSSHEFMVPATTGEDVVIQCAACGYAANRERAEIGDRPRRRRRPDRRHPPIEAVATPDRRTIQEVCDFLKVDESTTGKLLIYLADGQPVAALIRGDHEANEAKIRRAFGAVDARAGRRRDDRAGRPARRWASSGRSAIKIPLVDRPRRRRDARRRRRRQRGRRPPDGRRPRPRLPARPRRTTCATPWRATPARAAGRRWSSRTGSRSATSSSSAPSTPRRWGRRSSTTTGSEVPLDHGLLRHRREPDRRRGRRGRPRRQRDHLAAARWPRTRSLLVPLQVQNPAVMEAAEALEKQFVEAGGTTS